MWNLQISPKHDPLKVLYSEGSTWYTLIGIIPDWFACTSEHEGNIFLLPLARGPSLTYEEIKELICTTWVLYGLRGNMLIMWRSLKGTFTEEDEKLFSLVAEYCQETQKHSKQREI